MTTTATSLYDLAAELLATAGDILAGTVGGRPSNAYISHGPPAYDCCDTLTVHCGALTYAPSLHRGATGGTAQPDPKMPVALVAPLTITALRCVSRQAMPSGGLHIQAAALAAVNADSASVYQDGWSLMNGVRKRILDESLFAGYPCRIWDFDNVTPISPDGGCLGWMLSLYVQLDGFDPPG